MVFSFVFVAFAYDTRRLQPLLDRFGYVMPSVPAGVPLEQFLDREIRKRTLMSALILFAIAAVPSMVSSLIGMRLTAAGLGGSACLVACAVVIDTRRNARAWRGLETDEAELEPDAGRPEPPGWLEVLETDTELEAQLARDVLARDGVRGVIVSNRAMPLLGTLAPWEWTRPTYPSLAIHRRLAGGQVVLLVRGIDAERATTLLEPCRDSAGASA